jgi:glycerol-3-phosphate dehydrogenase
VNQVLAEPLTQDDLVGAYAGLRPLVLPASAGTGPGDATADLSRKHLLAWDGPVLTVVGGKLTTYRAMAEEAVDEVVARLGRGARAATTARLPLVGAAPRPALARLTAPARLVARYGTEAPLVEALGSAAVVAGRPETVGELRFAVRNEGARTVADLLDRRTRIGLVPADRARAVPVAESVLAEER